MALGLPIKMVVLTIVGFAGLLTMLAFIDTSEKAIPKPMHADIKNNNLIILSKYANSDPIEIPIAVINSKDGTPVEKASAALSGMDAAAVNRTLGDGETILRFNKNEFNLKAGEGYLRLDVKAAGFQDYTNEYAVKIIK